MHFYKGKWQEKTPCGRGRPRILTTGLDVESRLVFWEQINHQVAHGKTIILTTHNLEEADALAHRIAVINKGSIIAQGTPSEIKSRTSGKKIRCVTQLSIPVIKNLADVLDVQAERDAMVIHTRNAENSLRALLSLDLQVSGIEVTSAGLEEAFLALTRDQN